MKRGYLVLNVEHLECGLPVVAHTAKEAKMLAWKEDRWLFDGVWINIMVVWKKLACVGDLPFGVVEDDMVALEHKMIDYLYY